MRHFTFYEWKCYKLVRQVVGGGGGGMTGIWRGRGGGGESTVKTAGK
jgi:hypothetical protein